MSVTRVSLREWQTLGPEDPEAILRGVHLGGSDASALARRLTESRIVEILDLKDGIRVRALAHVGRIQLGGLVLTIEPKIGSGQLLELLRYTYGLRDLQLFDKAEFATTGQLLQDLICAQLLAEVGELVERGLARRYVERSDVLLSPRGGPDFLVSRGGKVAALLDAKYRDLWERDLPRYMLYQLAIYALSQPKGATAAILYPTIVPNATAALIEVRDPVRAGALGYVALRPAMLGELIEAVRVDSDPDRRARLAERLAFGTTQESVRSEWPEKLARRVDQTTMVNQTRSDDGVTAGVQTVA